MTCSYYDSFWFPEIPRERLSELWNEDKYIRFDRFMGSEPPTHPVEPCPCGKPDRWKCWNWTRSHRLLKTV